MSANAPTNDGITSGSASSTRQTRREGQVGPRDEPSRQRAEDRARHRDGSREGQRARERPERVVGSQHLERSVAELHGADDEISERCTERGRDHEADDDETNRCSPHQTHRIIARGRSPRSSVGSLRVRLPGSSGRPEVTRSRRVAGGPAPARRHARADTRRSPRRRTPASLSDSRNSRNRSAPSGLSAVSSTPAAVTSTNDPMSPSSKK